MAVTLMTPIELANRLGVTRLTIYRWIKSGRLRTVQIGGKHNSIRIPIDEKELEYGYHQTRAMGGMPDQKALGQTEDQGD